MTKQAIIILAIVVILAGVGLLFLRGSEDRWICQNGQWVKHGQPSTATPTDPCLIEPGAITNFEECVQAGNSVMESWPRKCRAEDGQTFVEDIGNELEKIDLIRLNTPRPNQQITSPLLIEGEARGAWFFEADFPIKLLDENGEVVVEHYATAQGEWMTEDFVPFKAEIEFDLPAGSKATLILEKDNPSGLPEHDDLLRAPLIIGQSLEMITLQAYFNNVQLDPEISCTKVFPVQRQAPKTQGVARAALEELLKGPNQQEQAQGYSTNINQGVAIQSLVIEEGTAMVDFNEQLQFQVGGSCRVSAIRAQIIETLKQFPTVNEVVISIDGETEDILQP